MRYCLGMQPRLIYGSESAVVELQDSLSSNVVDTVDSALCRATGKREAKAEMAKVCPAHRYLAQQTMRMHMLDPNQSYCATPWANFKTEGAPVQLRLEAIPGRFWSNPNVPKDGTWYALAYRSSEELAAERLFLFNESHLCDGEGSIIGSMDVVKRFGDLLPAVCDGIQLIAPPIAWKAGNF